MPYAKNRVKGKKTGGRMMTKMPKLKTMRKKALGGMKKKKMMMKKKMMK